LTQTIGIAWAFPLTLAGLLLAKLTGCEYWQTLSGARVYVASRWLYDNFFMRQRWPKLRVAAFCWGATVVVCRKDYILTYPGTLRHELVHAKQAQRYGVFLLPAYLLGMLWAGVTTGKPYTNCFLEVQARKESGH
jgi:hypothetical protein